MMLANTWHIEQRRRGLGEIDGILLWSAAALLMLGVVMVFSASIAIAEVKRASATYYLGRHALFVAVGLMIGAMAFQIPIRTWQKSANALFVAGLLLLVIVLIPGIGLSANGARRWIYLGFATLQPSELMKLFVVFYASAYVVRKAHHMDSIQRGFLPMAAALALTGSLLLLEPDFGAFAVMTVIAMGILFLGGIRLGPFILLGGVVVASFGLLVWLSPYRWARLTMFLNPEQDPEGRGYQLFHSLIAFARGEWLGVGLGASVEKLFYLPEAHTDFLLAVIGEELGFAGVLAVLMLFAVIVWRAFLIGREALHRDRTFAGLAAQGIGLWIGGQAFINMGVNLGVLPTKGLTLPLMSFGGSGIVANCIALAVLLRVDWETRQMVRGTGP